MTLSFSADTVSSTENIFTEDRDSLEAKVRLLVEQTGGLLPAQGPLGGFAFLNPLQGLEDLPFEEGMMKGARLYGCRPYMIKQFYREKLATGRIALEDLKAVLLEDLADRAAASVPPSGTRFDLRFAMLQHPLRSAPVEELQWFIAETDAFTSFSEETSATLRKRSVELTRHWVMRDVLAPPLNALESDPAPRDQAFRQFVNDFMERFSKFSIDNWDEQTWETFTLQALWHVCREAIEDVELPPVPDSHGPRHRDVLLSSIGQDIDLLVHPVLIRFCASFTDQGVANWGLPDRDEGFMRAFCRLYETPIAHAGQWMRPLAVFLKTLRSVNQTPLGSIVESLNDLGVAQADWGEFLEATILALRGWTGILWQMEVREDRFPKPAPVGSLIEFVAIRLILERIAIRYVCERAGVQLGPTLAGLRDKLKQQMTARPETSIEQRVFYVFQLAQVMGWNPKTLHRMSTQDWATLVAEIESFPSLARRRFFQLAFEHRLLAKTLDALTARNRLPPEAAVPARFQAVFCIDAREGSFRRHIEEQSPHYETFGAAGFFGVAMYFRGITDAHFAAQCPIMIRPAHWVVEDMIYPFEKTHQFRARSRRALGIAAHQIHLDSRTFGPGAVLSASLGTLASIPLVMRVLFPEFTARIRRTIGGIIAPPIMTRLRLERTAPNPGSRPDEIGYSLDEMAGLGERMLRDIGLTSNFARLVFFLGHGSACQNNPHKATYDCGACSGNPGGQNGRALAAMLNHPKVRAILANRGLAIPEETIFVGGLHNTCDDTVTCYDLDQLPKSHFEDFAVAQRAFELACRKNAHERCRRFFSAPLDMTPEEAHRHVKCRSEDLAQTRPEYGNASNAICIVGRRTRSRGLFLDRRAFLHSYDPTQDDDEYSVLARILSAVIPVCEGINMTYYLSALDPQGWGCGTKLPHNVTSLLGVMDGAASDLRCGLPAQSVEIHEPVRLLFVLETVPEAILKIMSRDPVIGRILGNGWSQLAVLDPHSDQIQVYRNGKFHEHVPTMTELPKVSTSIEWYRGWRDHLGFALIDRNPNAT